jgi:hypothetical protein
MKDKVTALWNIGAAGDQDPLFLANRHVIDKDGNYSRIDIHDSGYALMELLGERLGQEAIRIGENIRSCKDCVSIKSITRTVSLPGQEIFKNIHEMQPAKKYEYKVGKPLDTPFSIMLLDNIAIIGVQVEMVCRTALQLKNASPYRNNIIMTMVNGGAKYLPDAGSYDRITYESMNSFCSKGSAEILRDEILKALDDIAFLE